MDERDHYRKEFAALNGAAPAWLRGFRERGLARFLDLGFPSTRLEDWKYTDVAPLAHFPFSTSAATTLSTAAADSLARARLGVEHELVFVNGRFAAELSQLGAPVSGVTVTNLAAAGRELAERVVPRIGSCADERSHAFTALNEAFIQDGAIVWVERGAQIADAIHLLFVTTEPAGSLASPRTLIVAAEGSSVTVVETYLARAERSFTNAVTEVIALSDAAVRHVRVQHESDAAYHVGTVAARQDSSSRFASLSVALGGSLVRTDIETRLAAAGGECQLDGLYMTRGRQHVDHHTSIDHQQPHCSSRELYKGVLDGQSSGVFNGKVFVRPGALKSDAQQVNKNLLLSDAAEVNTKPQLEIFADDVKCSHGATIGRLDEQALFYLRARGIGHAAARDLLVYAFANELISRIPVASVRERLELTLRERLQPALLEESA
jgi:Fe-S cluster assembly protein SufD